MRTYAVVINFEVEADTPEEAAAKIEGIVVSCGPEMSDLYDPYPLTVTGYFDDDDEWHSISPLTVTE